VESPDIPGRFRAITDGPFGSNLARRHYTPSGPRVVRLQNIGDGDFIDQAAHISEEHFDSLKAHEVRAGDLLVASLGEVLPRACLAPEWLGPAIVKADCIRVRLGKDVDPRWVVYALQRPVARRWAEEHRHGVGRPRLGLKTIRQIPVPLPPLDEQRRIVDLLEDHLSRLAAAERELDTASARAKRLLSTGLWRATHQIGGETKRLDSIAEVRLGRQRSPKNHLGDRMRPYLRAANVDWDVLRLEDVKEMQFSEAEEKIYRLESGDILLTEASGSPAEVGKSAIYLGEPSEVCFQNTLLRVRCHGARPEFVQKFLLAEALLGRFMPEARGVGINHLGRARLASLEIELPDDDRQAKAIDACRGLISSVHRLQVSVGVQRHRAQALRRSLLAAAFSGRLTAEADVEDLVSL
jgi:type I restriction enzyme S subunit